MPVPSWAKGKRVHFDPAEPQNPRLADGYRARSDINTSPTSLPAGSLHYHGGPVENEPRLMLIFFGTGWEAGSALALRHKLEATAEGLPGSGYQKLLTQYSSLEGPISPGPLLGSPIIETYYDGREITTKVTGPAAAQEARKVIQLTGGGGDTNATYAVLPAPGTAGPEGYTCGFHEEDGGSGITWTPGPSIAVILSTEGSLGCGTPSMVLTHEYAESVTDPQGGSGWSGSDNGNTEIGDLCNHLGPQRMADGALVASLWDDSKNACEVEDNDPVSQPIGPYAETSNRNPSLEGATNLTIESEELEASIYPCDLEAHYYFEYGTSTAYGDKTAESAVPGAWGAVKVKTTISGLMHNVPYHWRVVVSTSDGTADGADHEFFVPYDVEVRDEGASNVEFSEATLNDEVQPVGIEARYYFEYGTTEAYGSRTAEASAGSGDAFVEASAGLTGLTPGAVYHFRIVASSARGTTVGEDKEFRTLGGKPRVETLRVFEVSYTKATIRGRVERDGVPNNYYFEYGTTSSYEQRTAERESEGEEEEKEILGDLTPGTLYHYRIVATNSYGTSYGADRTFSTGPEPLVETMAAEAVSYDDATLSGAVNPRGAEIDSYFEYGTTEAYGRRTAESTAGSGTASAREIHTVGGLAENTTYHFRIVATNSYGTTYGADLTFSTGIEPSVHTNAPVTVGSDEATLSGTINPHGTEVAYYFEYGSTPEYAMSTAQASAGSGDVDVEAASTIAGLTPGVTYHYRVVAVYGSVKRYGGEVTFTTTTLPPLVKTVGPRPTPKETPLPPAPHQTPSPPSVQNARQSTTRWRESNQLARISRAKTPTGTTFSFSLNEQATVSFSFTQLLGGPRVAHRCLARTHKKAKDTICNPASVGTFSFAGHGGTNKMIFAGRISHTSKLKPGQYRLTITATNSTGQGSIPVSLIFTMLK
ncbi:MAG: fibronectin type III domain-containing protein [Solirubrobacteraceae bacterium]